jgi:hypothetical protein
MLNHAAYYRWPSSYLTSEIMAFPLNASSRKINAIFSQPKHLLLAKVTTNMSANGMAKWLEGNTTEYTGRGNIKTWRCGRD